MTRVNRASVLTVFTCTMLSITHTGCSGTSGDISRDHQAQTVTMKEQQRVQGEYIVTLRQGADEASVRAVFSAFDLQGFTHVGGQQWLLKVGKDPGPAVMQHKAAESRAVEAIQPNFVYRQQSKPGFGAK